MTDDRSELESAKDWLADMAQPADTANEPSEDEVEVVDSGEEDPAPQPARSPRRMLDRPAELIDLDKAGKPWFRRWFGGRKNFSLEQDGDEVAAVSTAMEPPDATAIEHGTYRKTKCRRTEVAFEVPAGQSSLRLPSHTGTSR